MGARLISALGAILAPRTCRVCGCQLAAGEEYLCLGCLLELPRTGAHKSEFNIIHQRLGHNAVVDRAAGWFFYRKGSPYAQLLVDAKYAGLPRIDFELGRMCAEEIGADGFFAGIDALVPMPMHWWKRLRRGYNQAEEICLGVGQATGLPIAKALRAKRPHGIQSRNTREERYKAIAGTLALAGAADVAGKHLLFVDDIITTGASAAEAIRLLAGAGARVSVLALALTASSQ